MSTFRSALAFFDQLGIYDVVLPFLLIFTIVFAMLEKTAVFGKENGGTKKNLNAMVAFCSAFLVVASSQLVYVINATIAKSMLLLVMSVLFIMLIGAFKEDKPVFLSGGWEKLFMVIMFVGIVLILLYNLGWLQFVYAYTAANLNGPIVGALALLIIMLGFMYWIYTPANAAEKKS